MSEYRELDRRIKDLETIIQRMTAQEKGYPVGTTFPTGVSSGFLFYRTDLRALFQYDGTVWFSLSQYSSYFSSHLFIPNLRGFWPMSNPADTSGNMYDISGHGRLLTWGAAPLAAVFNERIVYADFNGTTAYLFRTSEAGFNTTTIPITSGGWFWLDTATANQSVIGKYNTTGNQRSWIIQMFNGSPDVWRGVISTDGTATVVVTHGTTVTTGVWVHIILRFTPSTELAIFVNGVKSANTTSIPASLFTSTAEFRIGSQGSGIEFLDGRAALCFFAANALSDAFIASLYNEGKGFFV